MNFIYGIALIGFVLFLFVLIRSLDWKAKNYKWVTLPEAQGEHSEIRQLSAFLEKNQINTKIELTRQSASARLIYSKKVYARLQVKEADLYRASQLVQQYDQSESK